MAKKERTMTTESISNKEFIESTAKEVAEHREERIRYITEEIGGRFNNFEYSDEWAFVEGHRDIIGNIYRIIREACGFSLEDMAAHCGLRTLHFDCLEQVGFLNALDDNFHEAELWRRSISRICIACLKHRIECDYIKSDEISFKEILDFNDAVISDIDELLDLGRGIEDFEYIDSLESIKASYEAITHILRQYR